MPPSSHGDVPRTREEREFVKAAEKSAKMPSAPNRKAARRAWEKLPKDSVFKSHKFEG
jgi:hypothetical protein